MSNHNEQNHITDFNLSLIAELHNNLERQGPGSDEATLRALSLIGPLPANAQVADIGCGTGSQSLLLAENTDFHISAIDFMPEFIQILKDRIVDRNLEGRVEAIQASMEDLSFAEEQLDLIWSEGAIYNIGYKRGLEQWRKFLKPGGFIAVSEVAWLTDERPKEINDYWVNAYPEVDTIVEKIKVMHSAGYTPMAFFTLEEKDWWSYYNPRIVSAKGLQEKYHDSEAVKNLIRFNDEEIEMYSRYKEYYSYGFFIGRKTGR